MALYLNIAAALHLSPSGTSNIQTKRRMNETLITARSNPWVQQWLRYQSKPAERKAASLAWLEGEHLALEALERIHSQQYAIDSLVFPDTDTGRALFHRLNSEYPVVCDLNIVWLGVSVYKLLSTMDSVPSVSAVMRFFDNIQAIEIAPTVVLDGIQDPGNIGTLIRLCAAFAIPQVLLSKGCASAWSAKALRAGQGAQLTVSVIEDVDLACAYHEFQQYKMPIAATSLSQNSKALNQAVLKRQMVWVFGNEGQGIGESSQAAATQLIHIPMQGGFESLNVGTAAAICLWQWQQATD
jgi:TrmH family RNA methyltransferase